MNFSFAFTISIRLLFSTVAARIISSIFNFTMNRRLVFKSDKDVKSSMVRYYILWACQLMASYLLVYIFTRLLVLGSVAVAFTKIIVDLCLFVISYNIQKNGCLNNQTRITPIEMRIIMKNNVLKWLGRVGATLLTTIVILVVGLYLVMAMLAWGPSTFAKKQFILSLQETGELGFMANWFCSQEEIDMIKEENSVKDTTDITDSSLVVIGQDSSSDEEDLYVVDVKAGTYSGKLMVVKDPSRLFVGTVPEFKLEKGWTVAEIAQRYDALAGINGGEFVDSTPQTAMPIGLVMVDGNILKGDSSTMYHVTGITFDNKLVMGNMTSSKAVELGIRDCVNVSSDIGPFLIINGEPQDVDGVGGGLNPRTAIGQRADGAILLLVVDGRQATSLGASFSDLQDIMLQYGAVNASAMDGGTSTQMYYNGEVINKPYSPTGPRTLPTAFLIK